MCTVYMKWLIITILKTKCDVEGSKNTFFASHFYLWIMYVTQNQTCPLQTDLLCLGCFFWNVLWELKTETKSIAYISKHMEQFDSCQYLIVDIAGFLLDSRRRQCSKISITSMFCKLVVFITFCLNLTMWIIITPPQTKHSLIHLWFCKHRNIITTVDIK